MKAGPRRCLSVEERNELTRLLDSVPADADERDPQLNEAFDYWRSLEVPWWALPTVRGYRCYGGELFLHSVEDLIAELREHAAGAEWSDGC